MSDVESSSETPVKEPGKPAESPKAVASPPAVNAIAESDGGPLTIAQYSQLYAVSRNPFGLSMILPAIVFAFIGLEAVLLILNDWSVDNMKIVLTLFLILTTGLLLIPAVVLRGYITFNDTGISMRYGKQTMSATWDKVAGLTYEANGGVCVLLKGQTQSRPKLRVAGGLHADEDGEAVIPIRFFGDRRFAILYEVRDRVPESGWRTALQQAQPSGGRRPLIIYGLTTLFGVGCMIAVAIAVLPR